MRNWQQRFLLLAVSVSIAATGCAGKFCATGHCLPAIGKHHHGADACVTCGGAGCGSCLSGLKACLHDKLTCGAGCGDIVWDEWIDNPPECDPCDNHGGFTGVRACLTEPLSWCNLWGVRDSCGGCDSCVTKSQAIYTSPSGSTPLRAEQPGVSNAGPTPTETDDAKPAEESSMPQTSGPDSNPEVTPLQTHEDVTQTPRRGLLFRE